MIRNFWCASIFIFVFCWLGFTACMGQPRIEYKKVNYQRKYKIVPSNLLAAAVDITAYGGDVEHSFPMLSMEKTKEIVDLQKFIENVGGAIIVEPKLDGLALSAKYSGGKLVRVALRGDGRAGEDVTAQALALKPKFLPLEVTRTDLFEVRGELIMDDEDFAYSNGQRMNWLRAKNNKRRPDLRKSEEVLAQSGFKNQRNAIAGSIRRESADYEVSSTFYAYDLALADHSGDMSSHYNRVSSLQEMGFVPSVFLMEKQLPERDVLEMVQRFGEMRELEQVPYPTDGIVLKADSDSDRQRLGETSSRPRWSMAFKYPDMRKKTKLIDIEMAVGRTGNISFTAIYEPRFIEGSTISRATLHNFDFIKEHDLRIGGFYIASKANGVIPRIEKIEDYVQPDDLVPYDPERVCPISGEPLDTSGAIWRSLSPQASLGGLIEYACSRDVFDIQNIGRSTAVALVESGLVNNVADIFTLTVEQVATLPLIDSKTGEVKIVDKTGKPRVTGRLQANKIISEIDNAKNKPFNRVITSLGIQKCGRTFGSRLADRFGNAENLLAATLEDIMTIDGVRDGRGNFFLAGIAANRENLERMAEFGVNMGGEPVTADSNEGKPLSGMKVLATGSMTGPLAGKSRNEVKELISQFGGAASSSISKLTSLVVAGNGATESKIEKAKQLGIEVLTPEEFATKLGITE